MNSLQIREKRKELGLTQKKLAELVGVSTQTINGYENGKEIPTTKYQILDSILNQNNQFLLSEPTTEYQINDGFDITINQTEEKINEHIQIIELAKKTKEQSLILHHEEIVKLLKKQIEIIKIAKKNYYLDK